MKVIIELIKCIVLGLVQGLGEFLPISSSGHLLLVQRIFGITEGGQLMTVLLHVATLAAVCIVYREQILAIIKKPLQWKTLWLIVATLVTVVIAVAFKKVFDAAESGKYLGFCFIGTALILTAAEYAKARIPRTRTSNTMKWYHPVIIGALQGVAALPGVSRSGATITGSLFCGVKKKEAAEFSFLLSIPAILGGAVLEVPDLIKNGTGDFTWYGILIAMLAAGVSGYFAIRFMIRLITKKSFAGFIIYTLVLGVFVLLNQYVLHLF
ncbi:MAG: undecaprenyl-diphosphate phosphatase [Clostridiales bacterium]|nr:undecaprenyl-diphosphate phosphatase [Clostridiales bacterium]